jgi:two-component system response regulator PilR (NtrC family)
MPGRVLIVDDERSMREFLEILLEQHGYDVTTASGGVEAVARLGSSDSDYDLVLTDLKMPRVDGMAVLEHVKKRCPETEVVVMTAFSTTETAIKAMRLGAYDYLSKPFKVDEVTVIVGKCLEKRRLALENRRLKSELQGRYQFKNIIGNSAAIKAVFTIVERVARTRTNVLVVGETGTGKELVARAIHFNSPRSEQPFIVINCGAIPENLMESELFGHLKGSFTGAISHKKGLFQEAAGGTLFLDEIGELSLPLQVKLLRVLQEKRVKPIGGTHEEAVDVRIIAATNRDLQEEVQADRFRQDLYYRLNVIQVRIPPLRDRREDIPLLAQHFVDKFSSEIASDVRGISAEAMDMMQRHRFDGNVRELENVIERAITFELSELVTVESLPPQLVDRVTASSSVAGQTLGVVGIPDGGVNLDDILADLERRYLTAALDKAGGVRTEAARLLGMTFRSIRYKLDKYGL